MDWLTLEWLMINLEWAVGLLAIGCIILLFFPILLGWQLKQDAKDPSLDALLAKEAKELSDNFARKSVPKFLVAGKEPAGRDLKTWSDLIKAELKK